MISKHSALVNTLAVVMARVLNFDFVTIGAFRYLLGIVVERPDMLLTFSLFVTGKEFVHFVLDIASVFAGKLIISFSDSIVGKLDTDGWAESEFPGLLQSSVISTGFTIRASGELIVSSLNYKMLLLLDVSVQATSDIKGHRGHKPLQIFAEIAEHFTM